MSDSSIITKTFDDQTCIRKILKTRLGEKNTWTRETASPPLDEQREGGEERLARAWVINGIDHAPMARSNGG